MYIEEIKKFLHDIEQDINEPDKVLCHIGQIKLLLAKYSEYDWKKTYDTGFEAGRNDMKLKTLEVGFNMLEKEIYTKGEF